VKPDRSIILEAAGGLHTLTRDSSYHHSLFAVNQRGSLTLRGIVVDGGGHAGNRGNSTLVFNQGRLRLGSGAVLRDNVSESGGAAVRSLGEEAQVIMEDGSIEANRSEKNGGGVLVGRGSVMVMSGGVISGNHAVRGGGIFADDGARVTLAGGDVHRNESERGSGSGGASVVAQNRSLIMLSGEVGGHITGQGLAGGTPLTRDAPYTSTKTEKPANKGARYLRLLERVVAYILQFH
jgi:hypothetical protein